MTDPAPSCSNCQHCQAITNPAGTVIATCGRAGGGLFCGSCRVFSTLLEWTESGRAVQVDGQRFRPCCPNCGETCDVSAFHATGWRSGHLGAFQPADTIRRPDWCPPDWYEFQPPPPEPKPAKTKRSVPTLF